MLLGNKVDIEKEKWEVTKEEIEQFAKKKNMAYFETSAKTSKGINESFVHLANIAYDKIEKHKKEEPEEDNDDNNIVIKPEKKKKKEKKKPC